MREPDAVASHGHLLDGEGAVGVGVADVVGALDQHEGAGVVGGAREPYRSRQVAGGGQIEVEFVGGGGGHHGPVLGLVAALFGLDEVLALFEIGQHVHALGVGHRGIGVAGGVLDSLQSLQKAVLARGPGRQYPGLFGGYAVLQASSNYPGVTG